MNETLSTPKGFQWLEKLAIEAGASDTVKLSQILSEALKLKSTGVNGIIDAALVKEDDFLCLLATKAKLPWIEGSVEASETDEMKQVFSVHIAITNQVYPLRLENGVLHLVCHDPFNLKVRQAVSRKLEYPLKWHVASRRRVREALSALYGVGAGTFEQVLDGRDFSSSGQSDEANVIDEDKSEEASVLRFVNNILRESLIQKATDIHVEPQRDRLRIRYRIDGHLQDVPIPEHIHKLESSVIARLKIMSHLDVAEKRVPQDGRIHLSHEGRSVDVRVATIPSIEGETVSLRLLNQEKFDLSRLELEDHVQAEIERLLELSNGVILATGPTGSGKSTSLYCFLDRLNKPETRTVTIEDPVENKLEGVVQIAVKPDTGLTFAKGLRSILRADPNIVMVGEIRDTETAEIAIRASLTGHLVFSTLHTNSAIGGVSRLVDMGVEPFLVSASVRGILAQRLVRRLCVHCKRPSTHWNADVKKQLALPPGLEGVAYEAVGCAECRETGYSGRVGLYEICKISTTIQEMISQRCDENEMRKQANSEGFEDMRSYGMRKVMKGVTTIEEVLSSTQNHQVH